MAGFEYVPFVNPYAASIGDLLLHRNDAQVQAAQRMADIQSQAAQRTADAQAQATATGAQAWGNAVQNIGGNIAGAIQQWNDPAKQMQRLQLDEAKRDLRSRSFMEAALKNPQNYNADGSVNAGKVSDFLRQNDIGAWQQFQDIQSKNAKNALELQKTLSEIAKNTSESSERAQKIASAQNEALGTLAYHALQTLDQKPDDPLHARDTALATAATGVTGHTINNGVGAQFLGQLASAGPDQVRTVLSSYVPADLAAKLNKEQADTEEAKARAANVGRFTNATEVAAALANPNDPRHALAVAMQNLPTPPTSQVLGSQADFVTKWAKDQGLDPASLNAAQTAEALKTYRNSTQKDPILGGMNSLYGDIDPKAIAKGIASGDLSPMVTDLGRPAAAAVETELTKAGVKLSTLQTDWKATQRFYSTLNGPQQTRLRQAIDTTSHSLDVISDLAAQWDGGRFPALNKATLLAAKNGGLGPDAQALATKLDAQIADVTGELGNVLMGSNSPTDHALALAAQNLKSNWSKDTLQQLIGQAQTNLKLRRNAIENVGPVGASGANPYYQPGAAGAAKVPVSNDPLGIR